MKVQKALKAVSTFLSEIPTIAEIVTIQSSKDYSSQSKKEVMNYFLWDMFCLYIEYLAWNGCIDDPEEINALYEIKIG